MRAGFLQRLADIRQSGTFYEVVFQPSFQTESVRRGTPEQAFNVFPVSLLNPCGYNEIADRCIKIHRYFCRSFIKIVASQPQEISEVDRQDTLRVKAT